LPTHTPAAATTQRGGAAAVAAPAAAAEAAEITYGHLRVATSYAWLFLFVSTSAVSPARHIYTKQGTLKYPTENILSTRA